MEIGIDIPVEEFDQWINSLRSGTFRQGQGALDRVDNDQGPPSHSFCCLGVACFILMPAEKIMFIEKPTRGHGPMKCISGSYPDVQENAPNWLKRIDYDFRDKTNTRLSELNDERHFTFDEIADVLELVYIHKILD